MAAAENSDLAVTPEDQYLCSVDCCTPAAPVLLFTLPSTLQDCVMDHLRPIDMIALRLTCKKGLDRLKGHLHLRLEGSAHDQGCWQRLTPAVTHVIIAGAVPTLHTMSGLSLSSQRFCFTSLSNLVMLVIQPHNWPVDAPV